VEIEVDLEEHLEVVTGVAEVVEIEAEAVEDSEAEAELLFNHIDTKVYLLSKPKKKLSQPSIKIQVYQFIMKKESRLKKEKRKPNTDCGIHSDPRLQQVLSVELIIVTFNQEVKCCN